MSGDEGAPLDAELRRWERERGVPPARGFVAARLARERAKTLRLRRVAASPIRRRASPDYLVPRALALSGLASPARRNAIDVALTHHTLDVRGLPDALEGFRLLHVSDPHFGADTALDDAIVASVIGVEHDLCVLTGDYRYRSHGPIDAAVAGLARLRKALGEDASGATPLAVLGNHDSIAMVPPMEVLGIRVLLNECVTLRRGGARLHVAGVDDPRYYRLDDLGRALAARDERRPGTSAAPGPSGSPLPDPHPGDERLRDVTLLLAHSPERADEAAASGCDVYLCGHTHGGQICLPGGRIAMRNARAPLARLSGAWSAGAMHGYTSRGAGVSMAAARFNCAPEITLHTLRRAEGEG